MSSNRYPSLCARCGGYVEPGDGLVSGGKTGADDTWRVVHTSCIPIAVPEEPGPAPDYWQRAIYRRVMDLLRQIEDLSPAELRAICATAEAKMLRALLEKNQ